MDETAIVHLYGKDGVKKAEFVAPPEPKAWVWWEWVIGIIAGIILWWIGQVLS